MEQLLAFETILKLVGGVSLLFFPLTVSRVFGLPMAPSGFWPRLLGAVLIGIAGATYLEMVKHNGLSIAACVIINLVGASTIIGLLIFKGAGNTRRGRATLGILALLLMVLLLVEIAYI